MLLQAGNDTSKGHAVVIIPTHKGTSDSIRKSLDRGKGRRERRAESGHLNSRCNGYWVWQIVELLGEFDVSATPSSEDARMTGFNSRPGVRPVGTQLDPISDTFLKVATTSRPSDVVPVDYKDEAPVKPRIPPVLLARLNYLTTTRFKEPFIFEIVE